VTTEKGISLPEFREGIQALLDYVNANGGIHGAQIKANVCTADGTPEGSIACANTSIDSKDVAQFMAIDFAPDAAVPLLKEAGIPMVLDLPSGALTATSTGDVVVLAPSAPALLAGPFEYFVKDKGAKSLAFVVTDNPSGHANDSLIDTASAKLGVPIKKFYLDPQNPDYNSLIVGMKNANVDYAFLGVGEDMCSGIVKAASEQGFKGKFATACSQYISDQPDAAVGSFNGGTVYPYLGLAGAPASIKPQLEEYATIMKKAGHTDAEIANTSRGVGFAGFGNFVMALQNIPVGTAITAASVKEAVTGAKFTGMFGTPIDCTGTNAVKGNTTACSSSIALLQIDKGGDNPELSTTSPSGLIDVHDFLQSIFPS
jgi:branched-chain amino acid transport system substrate-binding protein